MKEHKVWLSPPHLTGKEKLYIESALDQNWVSPYGENIDVFERKLEDYFSVPDVALVTSGTAAIHLALRLSGVEAGDEVIVPSLNFAGCINPIVYQNAIPLFIDSENDTFNIDPAIAEQVIKEKIEAGKKPKAIIGVHLFGIPCKINELVNLSQKYDIPLIEDAADAIGTRYNGQPVGTFGSMGIISFNGNKIVTTSGGGALIAKDPKFTERAKYLSNQAREILPHYIHQTVGYNYMMSNIVAGIGRAQMDVLQERVERRREIYKYYQESLSDIKELEFINDLPKHYSNRWLSVMLVNKGNNSHVTRDYIYDQLAAQDIESRPVWTPMHLQPAFSKYPYYGGNVAEDIFERGLCLPSGSSLTDTQLEKIVGIIRSVFEKKQNIPVSQVSSR